MLDKILDFIAENMAIVKVATVTGTTDENGYISTGLGPNNIPLWCSDFEVSGSSIGNTARPCFIEDKNLNRISVRFKIWDDTVAGESSRISFKVYYIPGGGIVKTGISTVLAILNAIERRWEYARQNTIINSRLSCRVRKPCTWRWGRLYSIRRYNECNTQQGRHFTNLRHSKQHQCGTCYSKNTQSGSMWKCNWSWRISDIIQCTRQKGYNLYYRNRQLHCARGLSVLLTDRGWLPC